ncbi:MYO18A isoform 18, partial [Pongo abelii]
PRSSPWTLTKLARWPQPPFRQCFWRSCVWLGAQPVKPHSTSSTTCWPVGMAPSGQSSTSTTWQRTVCLGLCHWPSLRKSRRQLSSLVSCRRP